MTRLCLNMIVRNEADRIERCLNSVAPYITAAVILDTGSTDDTKDIIRRFFADRPHLKCWVLDGPFEDFSQARNLALDEARKCQAKHHADYFLLTDADMELRVDDQKAFDNLLWSPSYDMLQVAGGTSYLNRRLLNAEMDSRYVGATHEYLDVIATDQIKGARFIDHADGSNRGEKVERDLRLLRADMEKDPENPRSHFYLANTYREAGKWEEAGAAYQRRIDLGGWDEEVWNAEINLANCYKEQGDIPRFISTALNAFNRRPQRTETLYDITKFYREQAGKQALALLFCKAGLGKKRPDDTLFVADWVYDWGFREEMSILGFYGDADDKRLGARICNVLALDASVPANVRHGARQNLRWYLKPLIEHCPSFKSREIDATPMPGYIAMNPSVASHDGELSCIVRTVNYTISPEGRYLIRGSNGEANGENPIDTRNLFLDLNADLSTHTQRPIFWDRSSPPAFGLVRGLEDMRLFHWKNDWYAMACVRENLASGMPQQVLVCLGHDELGQLANQTKYLSDGSICEKNWMPLVDGDDLSFVYRLDTIRNINQEEFLKQKVKPAIENISGGSPCIPFKNGWLAVIHEAIDPGDYKRVYAHRFVWFSQDHTFRRLSLPFCFHERQIEFCAGLALHPNYMDLVLSYGVRDEKAMLATVSIEDVAAMLSDFHEG